MELFISAQAVGIKRSLIGSVYPTKTGNADIPISSQALTPKAQSNSGNAVVLGGIIGGIMCLEKQQKEQRLILAI